MVHTFQVTLGAGATQILTTGEANAKWVIFQNNAGHSMRLGDANITTTRGILLAAGSPGGSVNPPPVAPVSNTRLSTWYVIGTQNDLLDVVWEDGV